MLRSLSAERSLAEPSVLDTVLDDTPILLPVLLHILWLGHQEHGTPEHSDCANRATRACP